MLIDESKSLLEGWRVATGWVGNLRVHRTHPALSGTPPERGSASGYENEGARVVSLACVAYPGL